MRRGRKNLFDEIFFLDPHADLAFSPATLRPVFGHGMAFDIAFMGNADRHFFIRDQIFNVDLRFLRNDLCPALILIGVFQFDQLVLDNLFDQVIRTQDGLERCDPGFEFFILMREFLLFELRQPLEPHVQDGLCLDLRQRELLREAGLGFVGGRRSPDQRNDCIQIRQRDVQAFDDMRAFFGFP